MEARYRPDFNRADAESYLLKRGMRLGDYIVRDTTRLNGKHVVSHVVQDTSKPGSRNKYVNHSMIWAAQGGFFASKVREIFPTMHALLHYHSKQPFPNTSTPLSIPVIDGMRISKATIPMNSNPVYHSSPQRQSSHETGQSPQSRGRHVLPQHRGGPSHACAPAARAPNDPVEYETIPAMLGTSPATAPPLPSQPSPGSQRACLGRQSVDEQAYEDVESLRDGAERAYKEIKQQRQATRHNYEEMEPRPVYEDMSGVNVHTPPIAAEGPYEPTEGFGKSARQAYVAMKGDDATDDYSTLPPPKPAPAQDVYDAPRKVGLPANRAPAQQSQYCEIDFPARPLKKGSGAPAVAGIKGAQWVQEGKDKRSSAYEDMNEMDLDALVENLVVEDDYEF
eukprot:TRINITY_DN27135_c0_g1_i1.p1 TRINITY_DN27135_c0_g1~~TRINITY_DN27135_c0_g1_i1.p1  ORF type:complete len:393 (+),score=61.03 TRINITY_DN27135_c0_g1_i1:277-1455(+)